MNATCPACSGSGESNHYGLLDCQAPDCTAADERATLEATVDAAMPLTEYDQRWMAYQMGKAEVSARQTYWNNVAAGLVEVKTAAERAAEDRHHKPHAVYVEQEVAELRARLGAMSSAQS